MTLSSGGELTRDGSTWRDRRCGDPDQIMCSSERTADIRCGSMDARTWSAAVLTAGLILHYLVCLPDREQLGADEPRGLNTKEGVVLCTDEHLRERSCCRSSGEETAERWEPVSDLSSHLCVCCVSNNLFDFFKSSPAALSLSVFTY